MQAELEKINRQNIAKQLQQQHEEANNKEEDIPLIKHDHDFTHATQHGIVTPAADKYPAAMVLVPTQGATVEQPAIDEPIYEKYTPEFPQHHQPHTVGAQQLQHHAIEHQLITAKDHSIALTPTTATTATTTATADSR